MTKSILAAVISLTFVSISTSAQTTPITATPAASESFKPMVNPQDTQAAPLPGDFGPPGAVQQQQQATTAQQQALLQQQAAAYAAQQAALQRPNINSNSKKPADILAAFMSMFNGQGANGKGGVPNPYLPNGEINPAFQDYVQGGGKLPTKDYEYSDGFSPDYSRKEVKIAPSEICKYPLANANKNFAGHDCNERSNDRMTCMVCNLYFEAGVEPQAGQIAVGRSSIRRLFSSYANPGEGLCKVVYRITRSRSSGARVAQYSWVIENKNHVLPAGEDLNRVMDSARKAFCAGPNEFTNYFAPKIVNPAWNREAGECRDGVRQHFPGPTGGHQFCRINGTINRSVAEVMASEGVSLASGSASETSSGAR